MIVVSAVFPLPNIAPIESVLLAPVQHFVFSDDEVRVSRIEFDRRAVGEQRDTAFCAVTAWAQIYRSRADMPESDRRRLYAVALMMDRWDGRVGFPGGLVGRGESPEAAALRELFEETALRPTRPITPLVAHERRDILVRLYHADLGIMAPRELRNIVARAAMARDAVAEGFAVWRHFTAYPRGKGLPVLCEAGNLATAVAEGIEALASALSASSPADAAPVLSASTRFGGRTPQRTST